MTTIQTTPAGRWVTVARWPAAATSTARAEQHLHRLDAHLRRALTLLDEAEERPW